MKRLPNLLVPLAICALAVAPAGAREFEDQFGRVIDAELVSHTGKDADTVSIKLAKTDKTMDLEIAKLSTADQEFVRKWMKENPPTISYAFRIEAVKSKIGSRSAASYGIKITNLARDTVSGLKVKTRSLYDHYYVPSSPNYYGYGGRLVAFEEEFAIPGEMKFNQTASFSTTDRYNLLGVMVRVYNSEGEVVAEEKVGSTKLARTAWEDGKARKLTPGGIEEDDGTGGTTTVTIED